MIKGREEVWVVQPGRYVIVDVDWKRKKEMYRVAFTTGALNASSIFSINTSVFGTLFANSIAAAISVSLITPRDQGP